MKNHSRISLVIKILKKHRSFSKPALTEIAEQTENPFKVLVSCILSLRTKDATTAGASKQLYTIADNPYDMMKLPEKKIAKAIYPVGFYKTKAKRIKEICRLLAEKYDGKVPADFDTLLSFKGVGRKTANIVMVYGFHKPGIPVDTHVHRVSNRLGWVDTKMPDKTEFALRKIVPRRYWLDLNDLLVQFGQNICRPINPKCSICPISRYCEYYRNVYLKNQGVRYADV